MGSLLFREKRLLALAVAVIVAVGSLSLLSIGRQEDPTITNLFATVLTPFPGAAPDRVEALVTEEIENELREIAEIKEINSISRSGLSVVTVELSELISDSEIEQAWSEIRDALGDAALRFPAGVPEPEFDNDRTGAYTAISGLLARPGVDAGPGLLRRYAELLQDRLRAVPGTKVVRLFGARDEEILVQIDPDRLASLGLTAQAVARAIAQADAKVEAGGVRGNRHELLVELSGEIEALARISAIPLVDGADGRMTRVGDVAEIRRTVLDPPRTLALIDGRPGIMIAAAMEPDLQVDRWAEAVRSALAEVEAQLPAGIEHRLLFDQSRYTAERFSTLLQNIAIGSALVVAVLLLTLGWRAALTVALILPLTALMSIAVLQYLGVSIQQMSVTGLIVALGLLVDSAIVITDDVRQRLAAGDRTGDAVTHAVRRLLIPLLASTLTTVLAFLPMALLPGPAGDFVGSIAIAVIVMLLSSFLLSVTVTPALAGILLPKGGPDRSASLWRNGLQPGAIGRAFAWSIRLALRHRLQAVLAALALPAIGFGAFPTLTAQFFPGVERNQFYVQVKLPEGAAIGRTAEVARAADRQLRAQDGIVQVNWAIGDSAPSFYYNMLMDQDGVASFAEALVTTESPEATAALVTDLQAELDQALPGAQIVVRDLVQGPPVAAPVELRLVGPDLERLRQLGEQARLLMSDLPGVTHTRATLLGGAPKLVFDLDEDKVRLAGLDLAAVAGQLDALLDGATGGSLLETSEQLPVRVRIGDAARGTVERVAMLDIMPPDAPALAAAGDYPGIPLTALGSLRVIPADSPIARRNGERINNVQSFVEPGVLPEEVLKQVKARLAADPLPLPPGYRIEFGGDSDARAETVTNLLAPIGTVMTALIAVIVLTFRSYRLSLIAGLVCVLAMGLSLLALAVFGYPFGIQALIGVIGSIGVSINAAIIIMTALQADPRALAGDRGRCAEIVLQASRHIISTTVTTFGGFLPLILGGGGFWPPFAMAIAGGVLLSSVLSFYLVPPLFSLAMHNRRASRAVPIGQPQENLAPAAA